MSGDDPPADGKTNPDLALAAADGAVGGFALELQGDAGEVLAEADNFEALDGAGQVRGRAAFAKGFELFVAVEVFGDAEAHDFGGGPEHGDQRLDIVCDEGLFVAGVEGLEFGEYVGLVDDHEGKSWRGGRIFLLMDALTV